MSFPKTPANPNEDSRIWVGRQIGDMTTRIREFLHIATTDAVIHPPGFYYFGLIACVAYFESALEEIAVYWCRSKSEKGEDLYARILKRIEKDVSRATGLGGWKTWLRVLFDIDLPGVLGTDWNDLDILFQLRNQLAHGRTTKFAHYYRSDGRFIGLSISGSPYEEALKYLIQRKVVLIKEGEVPTTESFLTADVVRHFLNVVESVFSKLKSLPALSELKSYCEPDLATLSGSAGGDLAPDFPANSVGGHPLDLVARVPEKRN